MSGSVHGKQATEGAFPADAGVFVIIRHYRLISIIQTTRSIGRRKDHPAGYKLFAASQTAG